MEKLRQMPSKGESDLTLLQDEAPLYGFGGLPNGRYPDSGPHPPKLGAPLPVITGSGMLSFARRASPLVGNRRFCRANLSA